jgi:Ser/Thr protein kinase RdoA (MazF antagonist)
MAGHSWHPCEADIAAVMSRLGISITDATDMGEGVNKLFRFTDKEGRPRVLRIRPRYVTEARISFEHYLAHVLAKDGLPVLAPLVIENQATWIKVDDFFCEILPWVQGRHGRPQTRELYLAGELLGRFHNTTQSLDQSLCTGPYMKNQQTPHELGPRLNTLRTQTEASGTSHLFEALWHRWKRLRLQYDACQAGSRWTVCHGDYHLWNLLYSDQPLRITALLDLDMAWFGPRIFDLSYAVFFLRHALISSEGPKGLASRWWECVASLVDGYRSTTDTDLTEDETGLIPLQVECIAIHFLLCNLPKDEDPGTTRQVLREEYLDVVDWLKTHRNLIQRDASGSR